MKFKPTRLGILATGVALGVAAMTAGAAEQPSLPTAGPLAGAAFAGGVTLNGGASFQQTLPAGEKYDLMATIRPRAADVGKQGQIIVVAASRGTFYSLNAAGAWNAFDLADPSAIQAYRTGALMAEENLTIIEDRTPLSLNVGSNLEVFFGYTLGTDFNTITYTGMPVGFDIAPVPQGCPAGTVAIAAKFRDQQVCEIAARRLLQDMTLTNNNAYFFRGTLFVGTNTVNTPYEQKVSLTIDPGVWIIADDSQGALVVDRGGRIFANGTPEKPIILTSNRDNGTLNALDTRGQWGGLAINGSARLNSSNGFGEGEGSTGQYGGGNNPTNDDNSGSLTYVQIRYAGFPITADDELNTLSLQGVGSGTILDYIHSHNGADDGIEFYGGTANARHVLITGQDDDALDWTLGWTGNIQHVVVKHTNSGDNCIEADNLSGNNVATPRSNPIVANLTCITSLEQKRNGHAFELKEGTGMQMYNSVIGGKLDSTEGCIRIRGDATFQQSVTNGELNGTLKMENSRITRDCADDLDGEGPAGTFTTAQWFAAQANSSAGVVDLGGPAAWTNGAAINAVTPAALNHSFFDKVDYIGGVKSEAMDWTKGWTFDYD